MLSCTEARDKIHLVLDGDALDAEQQQALHAHLADCAACRAAEFDLRRIQVALGSQPEVPLPDDALEEVLRRTVRGRRRWGHGWRVVAAAAVVVIAAGAWILFPSGRGEIEGPTAEQIEQAGQIRRILQFTGVALRKKERAEMGRILSDEVSPALRQVPVKLPGTRRLANRKSKS